jgi:hypothetical protein
MKRALLVLALLPAFQLAQSVPSFTDQDYERLLRSQSRILFYSVSPSMPLSVEGLKEIRFAATALHATLVPLADPGAMPGELLSLGEPQIRYQKSSRLRDLGIQLHYPSVLVSNDYKVVGAPIAGFKTRSGYVTLLSDLLKLPWKEGFQIYGEVPLPLAMNAFFKPVYGTTFIASGSTITSNYLFNLETLDTFEIPGRGDPGPSPDAGFVTILNGGLGLQWYSTEDVISGKRRLLLSDPGLRTYQSLGQLSPSRYRVLGALSSSTNPAGLIVRDFESTVAEGGGRTLAPLSEWRAVCEGKRISIPMMSKTGHLLSGNFDGTLRVFRIGPNATECAEVFDTKMVTGKADFNREDTALLYVSRAASAETGVAVDTIFLADLRTRTVTPIYSSASSEGLAFPGFMSPDRVVVYEQDSRKLLILDKTRVIQ